MGGTSLRTLSSIDFAEADMTGFWEVNWVDWSKLPTLSTRSFILNQVSEWGEARVSRGENREQLRHVEDCKLFGHWRALGVDQPDRWYWWYEERRDVTTMSQLPGLQSFPIWTLNNALPQRVKANYSSETHRSNGSRWWSIISVVTTECRVDSTCLRRQAFWLTSRSSSCVLRRNMARTELASLSHCRILFVSEPLDEEDLYRRCEMAEWSRLTS